MDWHPGDAQAPMNRTAISSKVFFIFTPPTIPTPRLASMVGLKRWMFDNAPAVIAEYKKLVQQQGR